MVRKITALAFLAMTLSGCSGEAGGIPTGDKANVQGESIGPAVEPRQPPSDMQRPVGLPEVSRPSTRPGFTQELAERLRTALNPQDVPSDRRCQAVNMPDPVAAARSRIAQGDLRPFMVMGFMEHPDIPGVSCPDKETYRAMPPRGGSFVSDIPDVCGGNRSFHGVPRTTAVAYNRTIAADPRFQAATGCRAKDQCEDAEDTWSPKDRFDPRCAHSAELLGRLAMRGQDADFAAALKAYPRTTPAERDGLTQAMLQAIRMGKWDRMKALAGAGADTRGKLSNGTAIDNPVHAVFNQNTERTRKIEMAKWLLAHGADFTNPNGSVLGITEELENVRFMLEAGAPANGYAINTGYSSERPIQQVLSRLARAYETKEIKKGSLKAAVFRSIMERADAEIAKYQRMAVMLYVAGGRPDDSNNTNWWKRKPTSVTEASILLAYAHEKGQFRQRAEEMVSYDPGRPLKDSEKQVEDYVRKALRCSTVKPEAVGTRIRLCPGT